jgi:preprotein translocase subunit YajC
MTPANPDGGANPLSMLLPIIGMLAIFYFLLIRPQQKRQKQAKEMVGALKNGDRVVTSAGIYGTVSGIKDDIIILKIAENVKIEVLKSAVSGVVNKS